MAWRGKYSWPEEGLIVFYRLGAMDAQTGLSEYS